MCGSVADCSVKLMRACVRRLCRSALHEPSLTCLEKGRARPCILKIRSGRLPRFHRDAVLATGSRRGRWSGGDCSGRAAAHGLLAARAMAGLAAAGQRARRVSDEHNNPMLGRSIAGQHSSAFKVAAQGSTKRRQAGTLTYGHTNLRVPLHGEQWLCAVRDVPIM